MLNTDAIVKFLRKSSVLLSAVAIGCGLTYFVTDSIEGSKIADLQKQIETLKKKELQARVTQRVSEQMEGIATQQTLISNKERDRAEQQSQIADMERGKAEIEKGLAEEAQMKALASADEAQKAKIIAEQQSKIATDNMILAQKAQAHADTLMYFSLANSLAQSSTAQTDGNLSHLLAYSSWYFADRYGADISNFGNVYNALLRSSGEMYSVNAYMHGNIRRLRTCDNENISVTDYGEVLVASTDKDGFEYKQVGDYDFRDIVTNGKNDNTVLTVDGCLFSMNLTTLMTESKISDASFKQRLQLPQDQWYRLVSSNDGKTLIAMGSRSVAWIDANTFSVISTQKFDDDLSSIGMQNGILHIFSKGSQHYISDKPGVVTSMNLTGMQGYVTAYLYDTTTERHILGMASGDIYIYDKQGVQLLRLTGHTGSITELRTYGVQLISTSLDGTLNLWNISDLTSIITPVSIDFLYKPLTFDVDSNDGLVYVGNGSVIRGFCCDATRNAASTQYGLTRDFTDEEWNHYIGKDIERVKFMK